MSSNEIGVGRSRFDPDTVLLQTHNKVIQVHTRLVNIMK